MVGRWTRAATNYIGDSCLRSRKRRWPLERRRRGPFSFPLLIYLPAVTDRGSLRVPAGSQARGFGPTDEKLYLIKRLRTEPRLGGQEDENYDVEDDW